MDCSPWNSPDQNTGVGSLSLLQGIFSTQGLYPGLQHCSWFLYQLSHKGSLRLLEWVAYPFSSRSSQPRNQTRVSCIAGRFFNNWAMRETLIVKWVKILILTILILPVQEHGTPFHLFVLSSFFSSVAHSFPTVGLLPPSVQFSHSVVSDSLRLHELQHARPPCPSPTPGVHSNSHPSSRWCHPAISSSVVPFSSWISSSQSLPASESFPMSQLFTWGGQITGASALASFLPKKSQVWSPSEWTGWISLQSKGLSRVFSNTTV